MAAAHIPAKQLTYKGTYDVLSSNLLEREIGWCTDDNILYVKGPNGLIPLSKIRVIDPETTYETVRDYINRGIIPVMRITQESVDQYLYLQWADDMDLRFGAISSDRYYWATWDMESGSWVFGDDEIGGKYSAGNGIGIDETNVISALLGECLEFDPYGNITVSDRSLAVKKLKDIKTLAVDGESFVLSEFGKYLILKLTADAELSATSENAVQNKVIYEAIGNVEALLAAL